MDSSGFVTSNTVSSVPNPGQNRAEGKKKRRNSLKLRLIYEYGAEGGI
jgi:hypothetical protein